jgi:hypothetical protein
VHSVDVRLMAFYDKNLKQGDVFEWPSLDQFETELSSGDSRLDTVSSSGVLSDTYEATDRLDVPSGGAWDSATRYHAFLDPLIPRSPAPTPLLTRDVLRNQMHGVDCYAV